MAVPPKSYKAVAAIAQKRRDANLSSFYQLPPINVSSLPNDLTLFPRQSGLLSPGEVEIVESQAEDILEKLANRVWSAVDVTQAFCKSASIAQKLASCSISREALERARYLDEYIEREGETIGPLHGLPISLKDCFVTPPHPSSVGMAAFANAPLHTESVIVAVLRQLGAVSYVKTNVPTAMMMAETDNNVWGETINPLHKMTSPGGSSGGEGALLALRGSPLGVGTDIGGSIRIPSAWCHLYGLKPSFGRFPTYGTKSGIPGQEFILSVNGPMSRSLKSIQLYSKHLLSENVSVWNLDHKCLPIPWRENVVQPKGRKLRLGLVGIDDGLITCHPPVERALGLVKDALAEQGHEIVPWATPDHPEIVKNLLAAFFDFGGAAILSYLQPYKEPVFGSMHGYAEAAKVGENDLGPTKLRMMNLKRNALQNAYLNRWMQTATSGKQPLDGIIMAASPWTAARLGQTQKNLYIGYTGVFNFLDFTSCTFPVTRTDKVVDKARELGKFTALSDLDARIQEDYDPEFYHGSPVSLQLAGKRLEEEKVLEMVEIVTDALQQHGVSV